MGFRWVTLNEGLNGHYFALLFYRIRHHWEPIINYVKVVEDRAVFVDYKRQKYSPKYLVFSYMTNKRIGKFISCCGCDTGFISTYSGLEFANSEHLSR